MGSYCSQAGESIEMSDKCVVDFASGWFSKGQQRIRETFIEQGYDGDFLFYNDTEQFDHTGNGYFCSEAPVVRRY